MTIPKTIVIWGCEDIFKFIIEFLLACKDHWDVISIADSEGLDTLISVVEKTQPDIVVIHQGCHYDRDSFPMELLRDHPAIMVITVGLDDNEIEVTSKQKILIRQASDLINLIEHEP